MAESKLREKWMYYDWSRVDRCFPLSVRLSLFVQGEISSWRRSTQVFHPPLIWTAKFVSLHLVPPPPYFFFYLYPCLIVPYEAIVSRLWIVYSVEQPVNWNLSLTQISCDVVERPWETWVEKQTKHFVWCIYKCGLLTLLGGGKSIYFLWKIYQS